MISSKITTKISHPVNFKMVDLEATDQRDAVQPSGDLSRPVGTMQNLESEISQLNAQVQRLQDKVVMLESDALALDNGTQFPRFNALPAEIRW